VTEKLSDAFHSGAAPQQPGRICVPVLVGPEVDAGAHPQPTHQVVDGGVAPRVPFRLRPQVDEHVVRIQGAVLAVEIVDIQAHQLRAGRHPPAHTALGPGAVVVAPRPDGEGSARDVEILVTQP
jgi:hypothetical protein